MRHFPVFLSTEAQRVAVIGGGAAALAKLRLVLRTEARVTVFAPEPAAEIRDWAAEGRLRLVSSLPATAEAFQGHRLAYVATGRKDRDRALAALARAAGALVNIVDDLDGSDFITPAMVDRDPVVIAIGTEGAAPVLARRLKARIEAMLPAGTGTLARAGRAFRAAAAALPGGRARRLFWDRFYGSVGPQALAAGGETALAPALRALAEETRRAAALPGSITIVAAGTGNPDDLTARARRALDEADLVIVEPGVPAALLELARREAEIVAPEGAALTARLEAAAAEAQKGAAVAVLARRDGHSLAARTRLAATAAGGPAPALLRPAPAPMPLPGAANSIDAPRARRAALTTTRPER